MVGAVDVYQRGHRWLGFPLAVIYKFGDDQGLYLAALITYYGFLSLFPLLLLLVTILGFLIHGVRTCRPGSSILRLSIFRLLVASCAGICTLFPGAAWVLWLAYWARCMAASGRPERRRTRSTGPGRCLAISDRTRSRFESAASCC